LLRFRKKLLYRLLLITMFYSIKIECLFDICKKMSLKVRSIIQVFLRSVFCCYEISLFDLVLLRILLYLPFCC